MSEKTKGYLYLAVCIACIITCLVLIGSIFFEKKIEVQMPSEAGAKITENAAKTGEAEIHKPKIAKQISEEKAAKQGEMLVTQDYAAAVITSIMPSDFPISNVGVKVEKSGKIAISGEVIAEDFKSFLDEKGANLGAKEWFIMKFMGKKAKLCLAFDCKIEEQGKFLLQPNAIKINNKEISLKIIPVEYCEKMSAALTEVMRGTGFVYSNIELRDGAIVLIA